MIKRLPAIIIALMFFAIVAAPGMAAQSGYIYINGITNGCNGGPGLAGYCVINGLQQEVNAKNCSYTGGGGASCHARFSLVIGKPVDISSPKFLEAAASGTVLRTVAIRYLQPQSSTSFYVINLSGARIADDIQSFDQEEISIEFGKISWKWEPNPPVCWDIIKNSKC